MLSQLLKLIETHHGELSQDELCIQLNISPDTLQNLLDILARKGRITITEGRPFACKEGRACPSTNSRCPGPEHCALVLLTPKQFSVKIAGYDD